MKKMFFLILLGLAAAGSSLYSLEIGARFHIANKYFSPARTVDATTFDGTSVTWGIDGYINHQINENIGINTGFYMDPILKNTMYTLFTYKHSFLSLSVGPFFGLFNSTSTLLKSGISTSIGLEFPGVVFLRFRADSSIGGELVSAGDYLQEQNSIYFGFYVPHAICSAGLTTRKYTYLATAATRVVDGLNIYSFSTDIYQKNTPYRVLINFSLHQLKKTFIDTATTVHSLNSLVAGFELNINLTDFFVLSMALDSSIYSFGTNQLLGVTNPGPGGYLFEASAGVLINIDTIIAKREI